MLVRLPEPEEEKEDVELGLRVQDPQSMCSEPTEEQEGVNTKKISPDKKKAA